MRFSAQAVHAAIVGMFALVPAAAAGGAETVAEVAAAPGRTERLLFLAVEQPRASVILLSGGEGKLAIDDAGTIRPDGNFLVRTRDSWAAQGFDVAVPGPPGGGSILGVRHSPQYREALSAVVDYVSAHAAAPIWIVGTSQGAIGAVNAGHLAPKVAGIVMTSPVTVRGRSGETVFDADPASIAVPALVVANAGDGCIASPPTEAPRLVAALTRSPRKELIVVDSRAAASAPCQGQAPHGYFGIEAEVVGRIAAWIAAAEAGRLPPTR